MRLTKMQRAIRNVFIRDYGRKRGIKFYILWEQKYNKQNQSY